MRKVFKKVRAMGGYRAVCDSKLWMRVCREAAGGKDLSGQTSASFAMRRNYEKTGMLEWEQTLDGTSLGGGAVANAGVPIDPDFGKTFVPVANGEIVPTGTRVRVLWNEENGESAWYGASTRGSTRRAESTTSPTTTKPKRPSTSARRRWRRQRRRINVKIETTNARAARAVTVVSVKRACNDETSRRALALSIRVRARRR